MVSRVEVTYSALVGVRIFLKLKVATVPEIPIIIKIVSRMMLLLHGQILMIACGAELISLRIVGPGIACIPALTYGWQDWRRQ